MFELKLSGLTVSEPEDSKGVGLTLESKELGIEVLGFKVEGEVKLVKSGFVVADTDSRLFEDGDVEVTGPNI